jgi:hypothetical protein
MGGDCWEALSLFEREGGSDGVRRNRNPGEITVNLSIGVGQQGNQTVCGKNVHTYLFTWIV